MIGDLPSVERRSLSGRPVDSHLIPALDGVRGIAIVLVLLHNLSPFDGWAHGPEHLAALLLNPGWIGVQLFFVLSGFLITGILLDTRSSPNYYRAFIGRRVLRIFPLYYATLFAFFVILPLFGPTAAAVVGRSQHQIFLWTYVVNFTEPFGLGVVAFAHFWSLAVEEQFYLVWPLVVRFCTPRRVLRIGVGLAVVALASRVALRAMGASPEMAYEFTFCRMDALAMGAAVAALQRFDGGVVAFVKHRGKLAAACGALLVVGFFVTNAYARTTVLSQTLGYSLIGVAFAALVAAAVGDHFMGKGGLGHALSNPVLRTFGKYSYGIYVFHPLLRLVGQSVLRRTGHVPTSLGVGLAYIAVMIAATFGLAYLSYQLFERHFLKLKRHFQPSDELASRVAREAQ